MARNSTPRACFIDWAISTWGGYGCWIKRRVADRTKLAAKSGAGSRPECQIRSGWKELFRTFRTHARDLACHGLAGAPWQTLHPQSRYLSFCVAYPVYLIHWSTAMPCKLTPWPGKKKSVADMHACLHVQSAILNLSQTKHRKADLKSAS